MSEKTAPPSITLSPTTTSILLPPTSSPLHENAISSLGGDTESKIDQQQPIISPTHRQSITNTNNNITTILSSRRYTLGGANKSSLMNIDPSISGSTDLSGIKKDRIEHTRCNDKNELVEKYELGNKLGQ